MKVELKLLSKIKEVQLYPGVLARIGTGKDSIPVELLLRDVLEKELEPPVSAETVVDLLLETGETEAARALDTLLQSNTPKADVMRASVQSEKSLEETSRNVMGLLLILRATKGEEIGRIKNRVESILDDQHLKSARPGRALRLLEPLISDLERLADDEMERARQKVGHLKRWAKGNRDLEIALNRSELLLGTREALPTLQRLLTLAERSQQGRLNPEDLQRLHRNDDSKGAILRPRTDLPADARSARDYLQLIENNGRLFNFRADFERKKTSELFQALQPGPKRRLKTASVASKILPFFNVPFHAPSDLTHEGSRGSSFRMRIPNPRVPALRDGERHFPGGIQLVVPLLEEPSALPQLLKDVPGDALRIVYYPGRLDRPLKQEFSLEQDVAHFDNNDLARLGEHLLDQRAHAFQQVILPRIPVQRVQPYQGGGPVSPEMFRGRREVISKLKQPRGGTVLFSGRMMGKSSILNKIHTDIQARKSAGAGQSEQSVFISSAAEDILHPLVEKCSALLGSQGEEFLSNHRKLELTANLRPKERKERLRKRLENFRQLIGAILNTGIHLAILIDEADKFAAADADKPREESLAWLLRDLEHEMPDNLRVVFAGFQTIHRQVLFENGAFANWFGLVQLGPLDTDDAKALVVEPFADLGFVFTSEAGVERILDFTGRHPLLIQETCQRLLQRVAARRSNPVLEEASLVHAGDVESVCRDDQLRDRVRQVLSLNLDEYPRLKLMVYLILYTCDQSKGQEGINLESFRLDDLKNALIEYYGKQFSDNFSERSVGALIQELMALGLLDRRGDSYDFMNKTFAAMLREDTRFVEELERLLLEVTNPQRAEQRRFPTLPNEDLSRILRSDSSHVVVAGLRRTGRTFIAEKLFTSHDSEKKAAYLVSGEKCSNQADLTENVRKKLHETRMALSLAELLVKNDIGCLVIDDADDLAKSKALSSVVRHLTDRDLRCVAFGGADLARHYVAELAGQDVDVVSLHRLRPKDIKLWGERPGPGLEEFQIVFDDTTSQALAEETGGFFPFLLDFLEQGRKRPGRPREYIPNAQEVETFARQLDKTWVESALLADLQPQELLLLRKLYEFARRENCWEEDWEIFQEMVIDPLASSQGTDLIDFLDSLEVLRLLDLLEDRPVNEQRKIRLAKDGALARVMNSLETTGGDSKR